VKSLLLAEVSRCNPGFPAERIFRHLSLKRTQHELSKGETGMAFVILLYCRIKLVRNVYGFWSEVVLGLLTDKFC